MKSKIYMTMLLCGLCMTSCTGNFEELDFPKTTSTVIDPAPILTRSFVTGSGMSVGIWQYSNQLTTLDWAQYMSNINSKFTTTNYEPVPQDEVWEWWYSKEAFAGLHLSQHAIELSQKVENPVYEAITRIWRAYMFQFITDMYGDIPYSEAFKSVSPKYDTQEFIYNDLINELQTAVKTINDNKNNGYPSLGAADVFYNGNLDKWVKLGNSMLIRLAMQCSNVAAEEITKPVLASLNLSDKANYISSNDDNLKLIPDANGPTFHVKNPFSTVASWDETRISENLYNRLQVNDDPRMTLYMSPNNNGDYVGLPSGQSIEDLNSEYKTKYVPNYCDFGPEFIKDETPFVLITASEMAFLLSEASAKGYIQGDAEAYYNEGIELSMKQYGISDTDIAAFKTKVPYSEDNLYTQFWISLFPNGPQGWNLVRRTGKPSITPLVYHWPGNEDMPRRFSYPTSEIRYNPDNVQEAITRMGGDSQYTRVWWDTNK